ncbi:lactococcin 972 family bacteriocin [Curtobacterium sp. RRHDQ66]|uniref:lactococcin 972 family bacteriocin n=1 Tax=Curtobacterium guangdongense TaxID=3413380 RepID=UPI003BF3DA1D
MRTRIIAAATCLVAAAAVFVPAAADAEPAEPVTGTSSTYEGSVPIPTGLHAPRYSVTPEGGGSWTYGTNGPNNTAYSNFYHTTRKHGSSVENGRGNVVRSATVAGGATAKASITKTYAGNHAYYRFVN